MADFNSWDKARDIVLFWSPEAGVEPHFRTQCVLARALQDLGYASLFVRCFSDFERCPVMEYEKLPLTPSIVERSRVCGKCVTTSWSMLEQFGLPSIALADFVSNAERSRIDNALNSAPGDLRQFEFDGIRVGALTANDFALLTKSSNFESLSAEHRGVWLRYIRSAMTAAVTAREICRSIPVKRILFFNSYSLLLIAKLATKGMNIASFLVTLANHRGIDPHRVILSPDLLSRSYTRWRGVWRDSEWRSLPLSPELVAEIGEDQRSRLSGHGAHTYSPAKTFDGGDILSRLGLERGKQTIVAYTSSRDEDLSAKLSYDALEYEWPGSPRPFADQIQWLSALLDYFRGRNDLQLIIRIHPREGSNRREAHRSQHLAVLQERLRDVPANCRVIWPEDPVSSYDLAEVADCVLTSWSSIGLEMARLGIPALPAFRNYNYPADDFLEDCGETLESYFTRLEELLSRDPSLDTLARAYRCYTLFHLDLGLHLGALMGVPASTAIPAAEARGLIAEAVIDLKLVDRLNLARRSSSLPNESLAREREALTVELSRIVHYTCTGESEAPTKLSVYFHDQIPAPESLQSTQQGCLSGESKLLCSGNTVVYITGRHKVVRYSPLLARMARLINSAPHDHGR